MAQNEVLIDKPGILTSDPFGEGWMLVVRPTGEDWRSGLTSGESIGPTVEAWIDGGSYRYRSD